MDASPAGSGTVPRMGIDAPGFVPHVIMGSMSAASSATS